MAETSLYSARWSPEDSDTDDSVNNLMVDGAARVKQLHFMQRLANAFSMLVLHECGDEADIDSSNLKLQITIGPGLSWNVQNVGNTFIPIPGNGIRFKTGVMAVSKKESALSEEIDTITIFYEGPG